MLKVSSIRTPALLLFLVFVTIATYYNSIGVPFYLDDIGSIVNNASFKDATFSSLFTDYGLRVIGYFSLFVDFERNKLTVSGYHYTNIIIHVLSGLTVYVWVRKLVGLAYGTLPKSSVSAIAFFAALIFLLHPLQTQAVTYIVQRLASLVALFYLVSMCSYTLARSGSNKAANMFFYVLFILSAVCALLTKQNAFTLPFAILLIEFTFFNSKVARRIAIGGFICCLVFVLTYLAFPQTLGSYVALLDSLTRETLEFTRFEYFCAQLPILWLYICKFFWPIGLHLDYGAKISDFSAIGVTLAGFFHIVLLSIAIAKRKKMPLLFFGIVLFYVLHAIESSIIPIRDLVFEHRTYLPNVALVMITFGIGIELWIRVFGEGKAKRISVLITVIICSLAYTTYQRNEQWLDPEKFYENELAHNPNNVRTLHNYAEFVGRKGDLEKSETLINKMYEVSDGKLDGAMVNTHIVLLMSKGQFKDAVILGKKLLEQKTLHPNTRVHVLSNMGIVFTTLGQYRRADNYFREAYPTGVMSTKALMAYAFSLIKNGFPVKAIEVIEEIERLRPQSKQAKKLRELALGVSKGTNYDESE